MNIFDLVVIAGIVQEPCAQSTSNTATMTSFARIDVKAWLEEGRVLDLSDPTVQRGTRFLEQLLATFTPDDTLLLQNYPNPFNPEAWIPYHLARGTEVTIEIYDSKGMLVHQLTHENQAAGYFVKAGRAAYWDGRNEDGEWVANGVYFNRLRAEIMRRREGW